MARPPERIDVAAAAAAAFAEAVRAVAAPRCAPSFPGASSGQAVPAPAGVTPARSGRRHSSSYTGPLTGPVASDR
ncbi:MAG TPA: hypothetical protein VE546_20495 [Streptomyces sp.]|uniref:hypothetical protein n=1 Tax=Streptomyces sp. TaxID=1931 RepID=UPI002D744116|nr:hypothetical protein [Streptomyces sp.]HZG05922.1 hypothetical protein [Streptomyces sp.]